MRWSSEVRSRSCFGTSAPDDLTVSDRGDGSAEYRLTEQKRLALSLPNEPVAVAHLYVASEAPPDKRRDDGAALAVVIIYLGEYVKDIPQPAGAVVTW
jgi:hypothetical protein